MKIYLSLQMIILSICFQRDPMLPILRRDKKINSTESFIKTSNFTWIKSVLEKFFFTNFMAHHANTRKDQIQKAKNHKGGRGKPIIHTVAMMSTYRVHRVYTKLKNLQSLYILNNKNVPSLFCKTIDSFLIANFCRQSLALVLWEMR